jgi:hypothetical protein
MELTGVFLVLLLVAALIEAVWEALKPVLAPVIGWFEGHAVPADRVAALIISLVICLGIGSQVDLFALLGLTIGTPYLGQILTAIILARGSNFVHDLLGTLNGLRESKNLIDFEAGK